MYVYESAPPSPRRKPLVLLAPSSNDGPTISLGEWKAKAKDELLSRQYGELDTLQPLALDSPENMQVDASRTSMEAEEGSPEDIRRRYFPSISPHDPSIAWMEGSSGDTVSLDASLRFDLTGTPIQPSLSSSLPTHLGLHHHAEGTHAGYTLDDIFLLSRSTVPAQRASMLNVLGKVARKLASGLRDASGGIEELKGQEVDLRKRILAAGAEAMGEKGNLGARAVEVLWVCIVVWDEEVTSVEGIELWGASEDDVIPSVPLDHLLPQIASAFGSLALPTESLSQMLAIVHHLAQYSNEFCTRIATTENLVANLVQYFLLKPLPPLEDSQPPEPFAIQVLATLASASRSVASSLTGPADALLRFVVTLPSLSPYPQALATSLLVETLRFYTVLASYGLYSHIVTTAHEQFRALGQYVLSSGCRSGYLQESWLELLEAWMVCARDPHRTTPSHDLLWSQVIGWGWCEDVLSLRKMLGPDNPQVWGKIWRAIAAWLEGSGVNSVRGGEAEKLAIIELLRSGFESGVEHTVVEHTLRELKRLVDPSTSLGSMTKESLFAMTSLAGTLASTIRLWLSCLPLHSQEPLDSPPFSLPFPQLSAFCASLTTHPLWTTTSKSFPPFANVGLRQLSVLLASYLNLSRRLPGTTDDLWVAQAFAILPRLLPGDNEFAERIIESLTKLLVPSFMTNRGWDVPSIIWEKKGVEPVLPFLTFGLHSNDERVGSVWMTPRSISSSTTQRLPPLVTTKTNKRPSLPLDKDWFFAPLNYLLRSGETDIFKSLPSSWDASETELVRATLLFARVHREVLRLHSLRDFSLTREETIFNCMKVFMLEHDQPESNSNEEVFRDSIVGSFMNDLLAPFTFGASTPETSSQKHLIGTLDKVAIRFLGSSTPFYQYYTDFVALYDAISFSHPTFAQLLLPPLSMRYPIDFRKYLWVDYSHILKTIKTPIEAVLADNIEEYMYPLETDIDVITAYLRVLVKGHLEGFLRLLAIHHISGNIWSDLRGAVVSDDKSMKLLHVVVDQGDFDVVREVVLYKQAVEAPILLPPACFAQEGDWRASRREFVGRCSVAIRDRLRDLL